MTLTEFLLARISDQEAVARRWLDVGTQVVINPLLVIAECEAMRNIVHWFITLNDYGPEDDHDAGYWDALSDCLKALALPYADHPDYREEWRP